jgi:hypothetical protein
MVRLTEPIAIQYCLHRGGTSDITGLKEHKTVYISRRYGPHIEIQTMLQKSSNALYNCGQYFKINRRKTASMVLKKG